MKPVIGITEKPTSTPTLPPLQEGEMCSVNITIQQKFTQPPRAYTEKDFARGHASRRLHYR